MVLPERRPTNPPLATSKPVIFGTPCFYARSPPPRHHHHPSLNQSYLALHPSWHLGPDGVELGLPHPLTFYLY